MEQVIGYITSPQIQAMLYPVKLAIIFLTILIGVYLIYFLIRSRWLKMIVLYNLGEFFTLRTYHLGKAAKIWHNIISHGSSLTGAGLHKSILTVGDLFEKLIARLAPFIHLNNPSERIKYLSTTLSDVENFTKAHQIYLQMKAGQLRHISDEDGHNVLAAYEQAFKDLNIIK